MTENDQGPISLLSQTLNDPIPYVPPSSHNKDNILLSQLVNFITPALT
ncbi:metalloendopeptidase [Proteus mirabilis]|nr:metalloendopeptidase [Proteus mirabilis]AWR58081.1 metalloendopeptidase [Proteus mirabilis]RYH19586.1 metalloendopeptidase [Proteus mirabilis]RZA40271.1 metalloendopeptidase [Proteus mirabilis]TFV29284.1 metalloendopeptidase [Proteus mirabilis]